MTAARQPSADERFPTRYVIEMFAFYAVWFGVASLLSLLTFAASTQRYPPGQVLPTMRLATLLAVDPASPGTLRAVPVARLAEERAGHPGLRLSPLPSGEGKLTQGSVQVAYTVRPGEGGEWLVDVHASHRGRDSMGAMGYVQWRYRVRGETAEPVALVADDPFLRWVLPGFLSFFVCLAGLMAFARWLDRPVHDGRFEFRPPFNRDWLATSGVPLRFAPGTASLQAVADELAAAGATVALAGNGHRLSARIGGRARVVLARSADGGAFDGRLDAGAYGQAAVFLLAFIAPVAAMIGAKAYLMAAFDPFAPLLPAAGELAAWAAAAVAAGTLGGRMLARPASTAGADRLGTALIAALERVGSRPEPFRGWPGDIPPAVVPRWRRALRGVIYAIALIPVLGLLIGSLAEMLGWLK